MKIPCAKRLGFVVSGLSFLQPALTNAHIYDFTLVATALILGSRLHLTKISCMLLKEGDRNDSCEIVRRIVAVPLMVLIEA